MSLHRSIARWKLLASLVTAVLLTASAAHAQTINLCQSKKKLCVAKKESALLKCHAKAEKAGAAVDPLCLQKAQDKFDGGPVPAKGCFAKLEAKGGCLTTSDTAALEGKVDAFVTDVVSELDPAYPAPILNACSSGKKKCVGNKAKALLKCHAKAEKTGTLDPSCVQKARDKFDGGAVPAKGCFAKLEAKGGCLTTSDVTALENKVDAFVNDVVCELDPSSGTCSTACPTTYAFTANGPDADYDIGWTGNGHDQHIPTGGRFTLAVSGCAGAGPPCGQCATTGPIPNAGGMAFNNRRCRGTDDAAGSPGTWITCSSNADCPGVGNACTYFFGPPQPTGAGGITFCFTNELVGPVTGTVNVDTGSSATSINLLRTAFIGTGDLAHPCPECVSGTCNAGLRMGQSCTVNGTSVPYYSSATSFDCPPTKSSELDEDVTTPLQLATGVQTKTLSAASPNCRALGHTTLKCFCDTCNTSPDVFTPCSSNADCAAVGATVCGGKRCLTGTNAGAPCAANSECPGGACTVPGELTAPNKCNDNTCSANPPDTDSIQEGQCAAGPFDQFCSPAETFRGCLADSDCPHAGDTCSGGKNRECFIDNGIITNSVAVTGVASTTAPTLSALFCVPPNVSSGFNNDYGLPGLERVTIPGTAAIN